MESDIEKLVISIVTKVTLGMGKMLMSEILDAEQSYYKGKIRASR